MNEIDIDSFLESLRLMLKKDEIDNTKNILSDEEVLLLLNDIVYN